MNFLSVELVEALHAATIREHGGSPGLRDRGLLESAVARAENTAYYNPEAGIAEVASSLSWGLVKNHAFIDGNKRIGFAVLLTFLKVNGFRLTASTQTATDAVLRVAAGEWSERDWSTWVQANSTHDAE